MWGRHKNKLGNVKTISDGYSFASKLEASVYALLKAEQTAGRIKTIQVQDSVKLTLAKIDYRPDFRCELPSGDSIWVEAKGFETPVWRLKLKLWRFYGPGELHLWRGTHLKPYLDEVVIPKLNVATSN